MVNHQRRLGNDWIASLESSTKVATLVDQVAPLIVFPRGQMDGENKSVSYFTIHFSKVRSAFRRFCLAICLLTNEHSNDRRFHFTPAQLSPAMGHLSTDEFVEELREVYPRLVTVAAAILRDRHLAEDVVQEAAMTGIRTRERYQGGNFAAWMAQIVRYTALNRSRQQKRRNTEVSVGHTYLGSFPASDEVSERGISALGELDKDQNAFDDSLMTALERLDPERRSCLLLRVVNNASYEEISELLQVPVGTAMSHVHRAKKHLRELLRRSEGSDE